MPSLGQDHPEPDEVTDSDFLPWLYPVVYDVLHREYSRYEYSGRSPADWVAALLKAAPTVAPKLAKLHTLVVLVRLIREDRTEFTSAENALGALCKLHSVPLSVVQSASDAAIAEVCAVIQGRFRCSPRKLRAFERLVAERLARPERVASRLAA